MDEATRSRAVELVRRLQQGDLPSESAADEALRELERLLPDPRVSDLIFWPDDEGLSAEAIVDRALQYRPYAP